MLDEATATQIRALPCWSGAITIAPLVGGITNRNYQITDRQRQRYVVRLGRDIPAHGVMRFNELAAARAAHAAGLSPEIVFAGDGCLVSRFIEGETLTPRRVRELPMLGRIADLIRRCHREIPAHFEGPALIFWVFQVIRNYLHFLAARDANPLALELDAIARMNIRLEQALGPVTIVFGHNDLLAANLLDDGSRLWLIDWDYAGFNSPLFDLANLASNNELSPALERALLERYFEQAVTAPTHYRFAAMKCASLLREALWGAVSRASSTLDFDYGAYARDYFLRFEQSWRHFEVMDG
jgi:thiamine kinase-like enzyme